MKMNPVILFSMMFGSNIVCMEGLAVQAAEGAAAQLAGPLISSITSHASGTFTSSSIFSNLLSNPDTHGSGVISALETAAPIVAAAAPGLISAYEQRQNQQAALTSGLQAAQQAELALQNNPSSTARLLRIAIGTCIAGFGAADLFVKYLYSQKDTTTTTGKQATEGFFNAGTDLAILGSGAYQVYLGITNYDNKAKQTDAAVATKLVKGHIAQHAAVSGAPASV